MRGIRRCLLSVIILILLLASLMILPDCNSSRDGYRTLVEKNKLCSFSFEYSDYYTRAGPYYELDFRVPFMYVTLLAPKASVNLIVPSGSDTVKTAATDYVPASITIDVSKAVDSVNTARNAKERLESILEDESKWENYQLIARYPMIVAGIQGEFVEYLVDWFAPIPAKEGLKLEHRCAVYFDHNGLIFSIEAMSRGDYDYTKVKTDFEHILQTFKILN